jgi:hypothetical protein
MGRAHGAFANGAGGLVAPAGAAVTASVIRQEVLCARDPVGQPAADAPKEAAGSCGLHSSASCAAAPPRDSGHPRLATQPAHQIHSTLSRRGRNLGSRWRAAQHSTAAQRTYRRHHRNRHGGRSAEPATAAAAGLGAGGDIHRLHIRLSVVSKEKARKRLPSTHYGVLGCHLLQNPLNLLGRSTGVQLEVLRRDSRHHRRGPKGPAGRQPGRQAGRQKLKVRRGVCGGGRARGPAALCEHARFTSSWAVGRASMRSVARDASSFQVKRNWRKREIKNKRSKGTWNPFLHHIRFLHHLLRCLTRSWQDSRAIPGRSGCPTQAAPSAKTVLLAKP